MRKLTLLFIFITCQLTLFSQHALQGIVFDASNNEALFGVVVLEKGNNNGVTTDTDGKFRFTISDSNAEIVFQSLGFETFEAGFDTIKNTQNLIVYLRPQAIDLSEVNILSDFAVERYNPISFSSVTQTQITAMLGDQPLPEIMNFTPGIFAARDGGGSGDATLSIRGFQQENIAVLLNGVPINGAENGLVYWNNWMGLAEVASAIQIQRGIGASKVALNSVGGTVNIQTNGGNHARGTRLNFSTTDYGNTRSSFAYHSGLQKNGWSYSVLGARTKGEGYVDGTYVDGWAYFVEVGKEISARQRLSITLMGGPEKHGQRNLKLSKAENDQFGIKYNKEWGHLNGKMNNSSENFYHKPHLALSHYLSVGKQGILANSLYFSPGVGGGKWSDNLGFNNTIFSFKDATGQIDWSAIYRYNAQNTDTFTLATGEKVTGYSKIAQTKFLASHVWAGWVSNYETKLTPSTKLIVGVHYRFFQSNLSQEVDQLMGGKFYIDDYSWSLAGVAGRPQIKMPGDVIRIHNGALIHQTTIFAQVEKKIGLFDLFAALSANDAHLRRHDAYNYPTDKWSQWVHKNGFDVKAGLGYRLAENQHAYLNAAWFSKVPYYKFIFGNFNNNPVVNIQNEQVKTVEAGYRIKNSQVELLLSLYYTAWQDVSFLSNEYLQLENNSQTRAMVKGLNAIHQGVEVDGKLKLTEYFSLAGIFSYGKWIWQNDVEATLFNDNDQPVDTVNVYAKGLYVGGQPQLQLGIKAFATFFQHLDLYAEAIHYDKHFAQFDPSARQNIADRAQPYRLPAATLVNVGFEAPLSIGRHRATIFANFNNVFNRIYILKGEDGLGHNLETFRGFWGFGRTFDIGFSLSFDEKKQ